MKIIDPTKDIIAFGKYKGMTYDQIADIDTGYILWLDDEVKTIKLPKYFVEAVRMDNYEEDDEFWNAAESYYSWHD